MILVPKDAPSLGPSNDKDVPRGEWRLNRQAQALGLKNARFHAASKAEQRVILAKDVLSWLDAKKLFVAGDGHPSQWSHYLNVYADAATAQVAVTLDEPETKSLPHEEVADKGHVNGNVCSACAIGSLVAVAAERAVCTLASTGWGGEVRVLGADARGPAPIHKALAGYFEWDQLVRIEQAFEANVARPGNGGVDHSEEARQAMTFGQQVKNRTERLRAIMNNIIDNKGTFIP